MLVPSPEEDAILRQAMARIGKKGGETTLKKYGVAYYQKLNKHRWAKKKSK